VTRDELRGLIRTIPDYPKAGILFRDVTTLFGDPAGLAATVEQLAEALAGEKLARVAGIEARGFVLAGAVAVRLGVGFVPVRKRGKLPHTVIGRDYDLEYGADRVEIHVDAVTKGERIAVIDDLVATGGTALAAVELLEEAGATVTSAAFVIDLPDLGGRARIEQRGTKTHALLAFEGH
jgi:adenine phosphoribosyltransferase